MTRNICRALSSCVRVRFAPSPTGALHVGGLRTALYNYIFAKKFDGTLLLRIEDTDRSRNIGNSVQDICDDLRWAGLHWDHAKTIFQSARLDLYRFYCNQLISEGKAYPCFCESGFLDTLRTDRQNSDAHKPWQYDGRCSMLSAIEVEDKVMAGHRHSVRFRMQNRTVTFDDMNYGQIAVNPSKVEGDFIILRSDGWPTYHLACVVDDHLMEISHVI